jgi:hypothetical protein
MKVSSTELNKNLLNWMWDKWKIPPTDLCNPSHPIHGSTVLLLDLGPLGVS